MPDAVEEQTDALHRRKAEVVQRFGPWTAHNIHLGNGVYTMAPGISGNEMRTRRLLQVVTDAAPGQLDQMRILDVGCLEGIFAVEFALHGAEVVGIEARENNVEKAKFAKSVLGLSKLTFLQEDVRSLHPDRHGTFDVVLCLGLLYHLDAPDVFEFVERLAAVCRGILVLDTHVTPVASLDLAHRGANYRGRRVVEHRAGSTREQRLELLWASLDNPESFWPTRESLLNLLAAVGFTSVSEIVGPPAPEHPVDRVELLARKGTSVRLRSSSLMEDVPFDVWPRQRPHRLSRQLHWNYRLRFLFSEFVRAMPSPLKRGLKRLLGR